MLGHLVAATMMRGTHLGSMHAVDLIAREARIGGHTLAGEMRVTHLFAWLRLAERICRSR
ncbi:hypothetical protein BH11GEM2_BH11GEM2_39340 [soil metagenome]